MRIRFANLSDAEILLKWRNDITTRRASLTEHIINRKEHDRWLRNSLRDRNRKLYIAEVNDKPVGTVRLDFDGQCYTLSWTTAPNERGKGFGKEMVQAVVERIKKPIIAEVKQNNIASIKIAKYVGMSLKYEKGDLLFFSKE